jgi:hypothetical protein
MVTLLGIEPSFIRMMKCGVITIEITMLVGISLILIGMLQVSWENIALCDIIAVAHLFKI